MSSTNSVPGGAPTPPQEDLPSNAYATYRPCDIPLSRRDEEYQNALMQVKLNPPASDGGIRIIPDDSTEKPVDGVSIRASDISWQSLPHIPFSELPLPLGDSRRRFASPIPGIKLTHPGGYYEGGPGRDPSIDTFARDFLNEHPEVVDGPTLRAAQEAEQEKLRAEIHDISIKRQRAIEHNASIQKQLKEMKEQHALEKKVRQKYIAQKVAKKAATQGNG